MNGNGNERVKREWKKGDRVIVTGQNSDYLNLDEIERQERNSDGNRWHTTHHYSVGLSRLFPYTREGLKDARESLLRNISDQIAVHEAAIVRLKELESNADVTLRVARPTPTEKYAYLVHADGSLTEKVG